MTDERSTSLSLCPSITFPNRRGDPVKPCQSVTRNLMPDTHRRNPKAPHYTRTTSDRSFVPPVFGKPSCPHPTSIVRVSLPLFGVSPSCPKESTSSGQCHSSAARRLRSLHIYTVPKGETWELLYNAPPSAEEGAKKKWSEMWELYRTLERRRQRRQRRRHTACLCVVSVERRKEEDQLSFHSPGLFSKTTGDVRIGRAHNM